MYASSMIKTFPAVVASIAFVLLSDWPSALPMKSAGFLMTTAMPKYQLFRPNGVINHFRIVG